LVKLHQGSGGFYRLRNREKMTVDEKEQMVQDLLKDAVHKIAAKAALYITQDDDNRGVNVDVNEVEKIIYEIDYKALSK
jgi:hypothetical protein